MKKGIAALLFVLLLTAKVSCAAELVVHAAASLTDALTEIGAAYERESGARVRFNFGASSMLARQIEQGAPGDLFLSADEAKMDALEKRGLLWPGTRRDLLSNRLVIIVPNESKAMPHSAADLAAPGFEKLALAETQSVPAGIYARQYLEKLNLWEGLKRKVVPTENVRGTLAAVESGNAEAGFVYKTDALISKKVKIAVEIAGAAGPKILYPMALLKSSVSLEEARRFEEYLAASAAAKVFEKFGFALTGTAAQ
jgi:molybdate transport system substrate-binding protein